MNSPLPTSAAMGYPFAIALAKLLKSGVTLQICWYTPSPWRNPVMPAMIACLKLDDRVPAGDSPRQTDRVIGRVRARCGEQHAFSRGDMAHQRLGKFNLDVGNARAGNI